MTKASDYMTALNTSNINAAAQRPDSDTLRDRCTDYVLQHIEHASPYHVEDLMDLVRDEVSRDVAQTPETQHLWDRIRKLEYDNEDAAAEIGRLRGNAYTGKSGMP